MVTKLTPEKVLEEILTHPTWEATDLSVTSPQSPLRTAARYVNSGAITMREIYDAVEKRRELALDVDNLFGNSPLRYLLGARNVYDDAIFDSTKIGANAFLTQQKLEYKISEGELEDVPSEVYKFSGELPELDPNQKVKSGFLILKGAQLLGAGRAYAEVKRSEDNSGFYGIYPSVEISLILYGKYHQMRQTISGGVFLYQNVLYKTKNVLNQGGVRVLEDESQWEEWGNRSISEIDSIVRKAILISRNKDRYRDSDKRVIDNQMAYELLNLGKMGFLGLPKYVPADIMDYIRSNGLDNKAISLIRRQRWRNCLHEGILELQIRLGIK